MTGERLGWLDIAKLAVQVGAGHYRRAWVASGVIFLLGLVPAAVSAVALNKLMLTDRGETLVALVVLALITVGGLYLLRIARSAALEEVAKHLEHHLMWLVTDRLAGRQMSCFPKSPTEATQAVSDLSTVRELFGGSTVSTLTDLPFVAGAIVGLAFAGGPIVFGVLGIALAIFVAQWAIYRIWSVPAGAELGTASIKRLSTIEELARGIRTFKLCRAEGRIAAESDRHAVDVAVAGAKLRSLTNASMAVAQTGAVASTMVVTLWGTALAQSQQMTSGSVMATALMAGLVMAPISQLAGMAARFGQARSALDRLAKLLSAPQETGGEVKAAIEEPEGRVEIKGLRFAYPGAEERPVLKGLDLDLTAGECVAILGASGEGKTTLGHLLAGLYLPTEGTVAIDGLYTTNWDLQGLRSVVGIVEDEPYLRSGTLLDNLLMAAPDADKARVMEIVAGVGLAAMVEAHPLKLAMPIGPGGAGLSAGQKRRVALARMLLADPKVVFLDAVTEELDAAGKAQVRTFLQRYLAGRTTIIVAHDQELLPLANRVLVMQDGSLTDFTNKIRVPHLAPVANAA